VVDHKPSNMTERMRPNAAAMTGSQEECRIKLTGFYDRVSCVATTEDATLRFDVRVPHQFGTARDDRLCLFPIHIIASVRMWWFWGATMVLAHMS